MSRLKKQPQTWIAAALVAASISCSKAPRHSAREHLATAEVAYCTNSIRGAERALLDYLTITRQDEDRKLEGVDYEFARIMCHRRLFLIYRKMGDTNNMLIQLRTSLDLFRRYQEEKGQAPPSTSLTVESFAALAEQGDKGLEVKWKAE